MLETGLFLILWALVKCIDIYIDKKNTIKPQVDKLAGVMSEFDKLHFTTAMERVHAAKEFGLSAYISGSLPDCGDEYIVCTDEDLRERQ